MRVEKGKRVQGKGVRKGKGVRHAVKKGSGMQLCS